MRLLIQWFRSQAGGTMVLTVALIPMVMAALGLTIDTGVLLLYRQRLAAATAAASLKAASTYELIEKGRGEEVEEGCGATAEDGSCAEVVTTTTCWVLYAHQINRQEAEVLGEEMALHNLGGQEATFTFKVTERAVDSPVLAPTTPEEKPPGRARWAVQVDGAGIAPVFFLRIVGATAAPVRASATVTWEKRDVYQLFDGACAEVEGL